MITPDQCQITRQKFAGGTLLSMRITYEGIFEEGAIKILGPSSEEFLTHRLMERLRGKIDERRSQDKLQRVEDDSIGETPPISGEPEGSEHEELS